MERRSAEIAGGGIAGLALAWSLARDGWRVRVHERGAEIREIGAGIYLMNNSLSIFEKHGIADLILGRAIALTAAERRDRSGRLIFRRTLPAEERRMTVLRSDLVLGLAEAARRAGAEILTNSTAVAADPAGTLTLAGGETCRADLIVAADGFRSRLRDQLGLTFVARERPSGATRVLLRRTEAETEAVTSEHWSGRRRVGIVPCAPDLTYAYLSCPHADARAAALPLDVASWQAAFPAIAGFFERVPQALSIVRHAYAYAIPRAWSHGRVCILGDAAHALPPTLAQGAGLSIANSYALAKLLRTETEVPAALARWEREHRPIADRTQRWSLRFDRMTTDWPRQLDLLRRTTLWTIGRVGCLNAHVRAADRVRLV
jgi:2-polyprenyl-6-methoxyphenol hydroxylase-like FAD-dependent oxidoreductase